VADFFFKPKLQQYLGMRILSVLIVLALIGLVTWNLYSLARVRTGIKALQEARRAASVTGTTADTSAILQQMQREAGTSFILLTLTLPIIGGICASVGWSRIQNVLRYAVLKRSRARSLKAADAANRERLLAEANFQSVEYEADAARKVTAEAVARAAEHLYRQGFIRGRLVPETIHNGRRLHERAQFAVKRLMGVSERRFSESVTASEAGLREAAK